MGTARRVRAIGSWALAGAACTAGPREDAVGETDFSANGAASSTSTGDNPVPAPVETDTDPEAADTDATHFDVADGGATGGPGEGGSGCGAVDFLFVVDSSGSMAAHQENLVANFPTFVDGFLAAAQTVTSVHVGVVTSDAYAWNAPECVEIGQLVTRTRLPDGETPICGPWGGRNYLTDADDLATGFSCAARVGIHGDQCERPMQGLLDAVEGLHAGAGDCNAGFLREDSLLVVVLLTDEWDGPGDPEEPYCEPTPGTPDDWFEAVVHARDGVESNVVVLSLINYETTPGAGPCPPCGMTGCNAFFDTRDIQTFTERFEHGLVGGLCETDYGPYFQAATDIVIDACDGYTPVG
ncbi:MAG: hypothetical protein AAF721_14805 [Myxococcota bacterium]